MTATSFAASETPAYRLLHAMLRVQNLERSIEFYTQQLGMRLLRLEKYPEGRFTLAFVGYGNENSGPSIELTCNWGQGGYEHGTAFGHLAIGVDDAAACCARLAAAGIPILREPGPMRFSSPDRSQPEIIAFVEDPDGYRIELVQSAP